MNPFMAMMYKNMSFSVWNQIYGKPNGFLKKAYIVKNLPVRKYELDNNLPYQPLDEDDDSSPAAKI